MKSIALLLTLLVPVPCLAGDCSSLEEMLWLLGDWRADGKDTSFHESWTEVSPKSFEGTGIERTKADGAVKAEEALRLVEMAGSVYYVSKVTHNEWPVAFRLTGCDDGNYVFENSAHDFPKRLEYRRDGLDRVVVRVSDGGEQGFTLDFRRACAEVRPSGDVFAAEDARFAAMIAANPEEIRRRLSDNLLYTHSNASVENREQLIETIVSGRMKYHEVIPEERTLWYAGDFTAIVRGRGRFKVQAGETPLDLRLRYLAIYALEDDEWKLRDWQSLREP